ncbi:hypothetical protein D1872_241140 [compost metagenome]
MKRPDIHRRGPDRLDKSSPHLFVSGLKLLLRHPKPGGLQTHPVELLRVTEQRGVAFFFHIPYDGPDRLVLLRRSILHLTTKIKILCFHYFHSKVLPGFQSVPEP